MHALLSSRSTQTQPTTLAPKEFLLFCGCLLSYFSHARLFVTQWPVACQAPLSMGFSRQENWSGLPFPRPEDLPNPGIKPMSLDISCIGKKILYT